MKKSVSSDAPTAQSALCNRIIAAAFEAFMENGYAGTSTLEIATRAKVSKRDLYATFPNKQAVLLACIANRAARMRLSPDLPAPRSGEMLASALRTFAGTVLREACQPAVMAMFRLAISEAERSPDVAEALNTSRSANRNALAELLARAQAAGILGHGDPKQMVEQFFALLWGDLMMNRLLGSVGVPKPAEIERRARGAIVAFLKLYANPAFDGLMAKRQAVPSPSELER